MLGTSSGAVKFTSVLSEKSSNAASLESSVFQSQSKGEHIFQLVYPSTSDKCKNM